jgi:hypothetical protein
MEYDHKRLRGEFIVLLDSETGTAFIRPTGDIVELAEDLDLSLSNCDWMEVEVLDFLQAL